MSIFKYTLPSGAKFTVDMPTGTTQEQADKVFYEQVASGTFVGYRVGDQLTHPTQTLINFGLSRLQRGTAGVPDNTILGLHDNAAVIATIQNLPTVAALPPLTSVPIANPVTQADVITVKTGLGPTTVGSLTPPQVQTLMAQMVASTDQPYYIMTQAKGIGKYGFNAPQLERVGYIKPGTVDRYLGGIANNTFSNPDNFVAIMNTPSIWTGKRGVVSVDVILSSESLQNAIEQELMQQSYDVLVATGTIQPTNTAATQPSVSVGQIYTPYQTLVAADPVTVLAATATDINTSTNAMDVIPDGDISTLVNGAVTEDNTASKSFMDSINSVNSAINSINSDIGALVSTANKYGPAVATAWSKASGLLSGKINADTLLAGAKGQAEALLGSVKGQAEALVGNVKGQAEALVAQGKQAIDNIAKSAQGAMDLAQTKLSSLVTGIKKAGAFTNTVDRTTVDTAVTRVIGSGKIPSPTFEIPNIESLGISKDIAAAQAQLASIQSQGQSLVAQGQAIAGQVSGAVTTAQTTIRGITRVG